MIYAKYLVIDELKEKYSINYMCEVLELNRSSYYNYLKRKNNIKDIKLREEIKKIATETNYTFGRKRMTIKINQNLNSNYNEKKIRRIMIEEDIICVIRRKKVVRKKTASQYTAENIMNKNFTTVSDNEKWSGDVTEINTGEGKLYVSGFRDIHSGYLLGHKISISNNNELVYENIQDILMRKDVKVDKLMIQTDRGYQYTSYGFKEILNGITHSMNRPGHCSDNSPIESFWGIFKSECYYNPHMKEAFRTREGAKKAINDYIEFYNNTRINSKGTTPNQIRNNSLSN